MDRTISAIGGAVNDLTRSKLLLVVDASSRHMPDVYRYVIDEIHSLESTKKTMMIFYEFMNFGIRVNAYGSQLSVEHATENSFTKPS